MQHSLLAFICLFGCGVSGCAIAEAQCIENEPVAWDTPLGLVVYESEDGPAAVFGYAVKLSGSRGLMVIDGLAGEFGGPGPLDGHWSEPDTAQDQAGAEGRACPFAIVDSEGRTTRNWGRLQLTFPADEFPGDWIMLRGRCLDYPDEVLAGRLRRR